MKICNKYKCKNEASKALWSIMLTFCIYIYVCVHVGGSRKYLYIIVIHSINSSFTYSSYVTLCKFLNHSVSVSSFIE